MVAISISKALEPPPFKELDLNSYCPITFVERILVSQYYFAFSLF